MGIGWLILSLNNLRGLCGNDIFMLFFLAKTFSFCSFSLRIWTPSRIIKPTLEKAGGCTSQQLVLANAMCVWGQDLPDILGRHCIRVTPGAGVFFVFLTLHLRKMMHRLVICFA